MEEFYRYINKYEFIDFTNIIYIKNIYYKKKINIPFLSINFLNKNQKFII